MSKVYNAPDASDLAIQELLQMHTYCRPAGSQTVEVFCNRYIDSVPGMARDAAGNRYVRIGHAPVLWSSHTDTVHAREGKQRVEYGAGILALPPQSDSACLGADCTVGVWIMRQMILRDIPGLYIFHDSEEIGGIGSAHIARNNPKLLDGIHYAIAFDRKGTSSVITHQGERCASNFFASELAKRLGGSFAPDDSGTFTDTANYTRLIPECTNLSVGYHSAHTSRESLDVGFANWLLGRMLTIDVLALPIVRDPSEDDFAWQETDSDLLEDLAFEDAGTAAAILHDLGITPDIFRQYQTERRSTFRR